MSPSSPLKYAVHGPREPQIGPRRFVPVLTLASIDVSHRMATRSIAATQLRVARSHPPPSFNISGNFRITGGHPNKIGMSVFRQSDCSILASLLIAFPRSMAIFDAGLYRTGFCRAA